MFLSGCRFGNHSESAKPIVNPSIYQSIEFFFTKPKSFQTKVILNSIGGPDMVVHSNTNAPLSYIPASVLNVMTDPVYFATYKDPSRYPIFRDYRDSVSLPTLLDAEGNISFQYPNENTEPTTRVLLSNPNCLTQWEVLESGGFDRSKPGQIQYEDGTLAPVAGNVSLTYTFSQVIVSVDGDNNCDADLTYLANCYKDGAGCSADDLYDARSLFDLYVKQTGVLNIDDAAKLKAMEYIIHYE